MGVVHLYTASTGLEVGRLRPGSDLVLHLHVADGADVPEGVYVLDHLDASERRDADVAARDALSAWRARVDGPMTVEGVCLPFIWELPVYRRFNGAVAHAVALRKALERSGARTVVLMDTGQHAERVARSVAGHLGIEVRLAPEAREPGPLGPPRPAPTRVQRARRAAIDAVALLGTPSVLRPGSIAIHAYWPLMPLVDRLIEDPRERPALFLGKRPTGVHRSRRIARQGGWIGSPNPVDRRVAARTAARLLDAARAAGRFEVDGMDLSGLLHPLVMEVVANRAAHDVAGARMLRRVLARGKLRWIVGAYDVDADARLIVVLAKEAGVRTLMLCHGCYVLPQNLPDLDVCDVAALWSHDTGPFMTNLERPIHLVGYPVPYDAPPPTKRIPRARPVRISVMGQGTVPTTSILDDRTTMAVFVTALEGIAARFPDAQVVLRPNPRQDGTAFRLLRDRFPGLDILERRGGDILDVHREADLTIAGASTATFQAALAGTPVIALNLSGFDWPHPLGGSRTAVPVARTAADLDAALAVWERDGILPGREDLLAGLGVDGGDATGRLLAILRGERAPDRRPAPDQTLAATG